MRKLLFVLSIVLTATMMSCSKYEEGGLVSRAEKSLTENPWNLSQYLRNGDDETDQLLISNFIETFSESGEITRSYVDTDGDNFNESGTWSFDNDKKQVNITGVSSVELTDETSTVSTSDYNVIKLTKDEFWYSFENGGDTHEFHFSVN